MTGWSGSQRATALAPAARDDRPAGASAHPQTETMHPGPPTVVRLEGPLALGHGYVSSSFADHAPRTFPRTTWSLSISLALTGAAPEDPVAAVSPHSGDCSRVLTALAQVKPPYPGEPSEPSWAALFTGWHPAGNLLASGWATSPDHAVRFAADRHLLPIRCG